MDWPLRRHGAHRTLEREAVVEDTDEALAERMFSGDEEATRRLVSRYQGPLFGFLYRLTQNAAEAEDLFQESFYRALRSAVRYDLRRPFKYHRKRGGCRGRRAGNVHPRLQENLELRGSGRVRYLALSRRLERGHRHRSPPAFQRAEHETTHGFDQLILTLTVQARPSNYWSTTARAFGAWRCSSDSAPGRHRFLPRCGSCSGARRPRRRLPGS